MTYDGAPYYPREFDLGDDCMAQEFGLDVDCDHCPFVTECMPTPLAGDIPINEENGDGD